MIDKLFWGGSLDFLQIPTLFIFDLKDCYLTVAEVIFVAIEKIAYFMKLVGWEQLALQGVPRWQVHKRVAGGSQRRGSVASPV